MPPGHPELQDLERADHDDGGERSDVTIAPIGKSEGEADDNEGKRMLAILADIGVWTVARRSEGRKGDGSGEAPGNQAKKNCHVQRSSTNIPLVRDGLRAWLIAVS